MGLDPAHGCETVADCQTTAPSAHQTLPTVPETVVFGTGHLGNRQGLFQRFVSLA